MNRRNALLSVAVVIAVAMSAQTAVPEDFALIAERATPDSIPSLREFKVDCTEGYTILGKNEDCQGRVEIYYDNELSTAPDFKYFGYVTYIVDCDHDYERIELENPYWKFSMDITYRPKGHLTNLRVRFPEGYLNIKNNSTEETFLSPVTDFSFNLTDHQDYILSPDNDAKVTVWPQEITLTFPHAKSIRLTDQAAASVRLASQGIDSTTELEKISLDAKDNTVSFRYNKVLDGWIETWLSYFIRIDAGSLEFDFGDWKTTNETINIIYPTEVLCDMIFDMADKKFTKEEELSDCKYSIDLSGPIYIYDFDEKLDLTLYLIENDSRTEIAHYKSYGTIHESDNEGHLQLIKNEDTPLPDGWYVIDVPKYALYGVYEGGLELYNNPAEVYFELDTTGSVEGIFGQEDTYTVYTAQGICVMRQGTRSAYEALPAGLYIVNGKKLIKK